MLSVENMSVEYGTSRGILSAIRDVSLTVAAGETVGLVGESGCGKSTLGRAIVQLEPIVAGSIKIDGQDAATQARRNRRAFARLAQMIFQDPSNSLDPRMTVGVALDIALRLHGSHGAGERRARILELLAQVGLDATSVDRRPHEFSGGQRQRIGIARALALRPRLIVCDEIVSALDVSMEAQVLNLLTRLKQDHGISYLFISHDLSVVEHISDRVVVMYLGKIVEICSRDDLFQGAVHPYTRALIEAIPQASPHLRRIEARRTIQGDLPDPYAPPSGCAFRTRCPQAVARCAQIEPRLQAVAKDHVVACRLADEAPVPQPINLN